MRYQFYRLKSNSGFTLIETLVASFLLIIASAGAMGAVSASTQWSNSKRGQMLMLGSSLGDELKYEVKGTNVGVPSIDPNRLFMGQPAASMTDQKYPGWESKTLGTTTYKLTYDTEPIIISGVESFRRVVVRVKR